MLLLPRRLSRWISDSGSTSRGGDELVEASRKMDMRNIFIIAPATPKAGFRRLYPLPVVSCIMYPGKV